MNAFIIILSFSESKYFTILLRACNFLVCLDTDFGNMLIEVQFIVNCDSQKFNRFAAYD